MKHINQKNDLKMNWKKKKKFCFENSRSRYLSSKTIGCKLNIYYAHSCISYIMCPCIHNNIGIHWVHIILL